MKYQAQAIWNNSGISHRLGAGRGGGREKACRTKTRQCGRKVRDHLWKPRKAKKIFERVFSHNNKINALTEVKEHQHLTASGITSLQKQTAGNNCLVCITDTLNINVRLKAKEIRFAQSKEEKTSDVVYWKLIQRSHSRLAFQYFISQFGPAVVLVTVTWSAVRIKGGKSSVTECLQVFPPLFPLQSLFVFFHREFFSRALLSERLEQAKL